MSCCFVLRNGERKIMSRLIILYNYNKYYNRIIKRKSSFQEYLNLITPVGDNPAAYRGFIRENMNFDYQDGVYAQHVINIKKDDPQYAKIEHPDYCVLEETYVQGEGDSAVTTTKLSRYFILDVTKIRGNQFQLSLRRDLLADYWNDVLNAPVFVEKGWINSLEDPAIFNKESMSVNQIKQKEFLLNKTKYSGKEQGWIVGYISKEERKAAISDCTGFSEPPLATAQYDDLSATLKAAITRGYYNEYDPDEARVNFYVRQGSDYFRGSLTFQSYYPQVGGVFSDVVGTFNGSMLILQSGDAWYNQVTRLQQTIADTFAYSGTLPNFKTLINTLFLSENPDAVANSSALSNNNGLVYEKDGVLYRIVIRQTHNGVYTHNYTASQIASGSDAISNGIKDYLTDLSYSNDFNNDPYSVSTNNAAFVSKNVKRYSVSVERVLYDELKCDIPANRNENFDAPYDLFCIPLGVVNVKSSGSIVLSTPENIALPMARGIAVTGGSKIYDIQILPYCPFDEILNSDGDIDITGFTEHRDYEYITQTVGGVTSNVGILVFPKSCRGTFDLSISNTEDVYNLCIEDNSTVENKKLKSETQLVRFVSPNFASQFEINVQKNKGITNINVDYFYKPYSPYIHVAPYFSGLYGQDFNDPKGLICSGEFSIATAASNWEQYQIQNKNYELTFNRQIEDLDINNSLAYQVAEKSSGISVATSALTGAGAGAASGAMIGSVVPVIGTALGAVVGGVIGAVGGAVTSAVGRKYDLDYLKKSQLEARSYAVDMYAYNLGNVQALPYTLTKVSAFTPNNKIFPFIEFYDCTEVEKNALLNKLHYNGMTIMRIGKIADFIGIYKYVSGQLIRLVGIDEDSHVVAEIAQEIKEGAYYYGTDSE